VNPRALELVADRWCMWLLVAVDEHEGSRFTDLAGEPGLSRSVLADRLQRLVESRLLTAELYSTHPPRRRYVLTERGHALRRICVQLLHVAGGGTLPAPTLAATGTPAAQRESLPAPRAHPSKPTPDTNSLPIASPDAAPHPTDRLLAADPDHAWTIYRDTVAPLVRYDDQYRTQLVETLETWLACDASVSVAAVRLFAHRHTVRYRLGRARELTGLDPDSLADRERLLLGLRALRMFQRTGGRDLLAP
jgi:DNA-binding PucR family transcriptional regulator